MKRFVAVACLAAMFTFGSVCIAQEKSDSKRSSSKADEKIRGQLPAYYGKLGLSDEQRQKIYKIIADYKAEKERLEKELEKLKTDEHTKMEAVLSKDQKTKLKELKSGTKDSDDKK